MDRFNDKASQVQTGRDISTKHLSFYRYYIFPNSRVLTKIRIEQRKSKRG